MNLLFCLSACALITHLVHGQDPCTDSATATLTRSVRDIPFCDASLSPLWYKFEEDYEIATKCITFGTCGTVYPLWMNGTIPNEADGIVDRTACEIVPGNCCNRTYDIQVKNCGDFRVYKLTFTYGCYKAYCITRKDEDEDCEERKGNFKCGGDNSKILIAITVVVIFFVVLISVIVWCYLRRRTKGARKPFLTENKQKGEKPPSLGYSNPVVESNF